ncbi:topoisomerase DNA-binding C4 zinc finger domain-containing protein [Chromatium okenii]|uniref:topoisomerase DNA-binding C4 zinc finger domain-containing protein n=1 Tax=Chromatium okenii TaxID=61644 RepID=UPI001F5BA4EA|nr:topoisomerase DNA-binding C4 zinc finger domain-containing protein [Chromatium okenii]
MPKCGNPLSIRLGRNGRFIGCTHYPECDYTRDLNADKAQAEAPELVEGRTCPLCNRRWKSNAGAMASSSVAAVIRPVNI